jgi:toxin HigB-1
VIKNFRHKGLSDPGFNFHPLTGRAKNELIRYSIHVNGPWCLTFAWDAKTGEVVGLDLVQYP